MHEIMAIFEIVRQDNTPVDMIIKDVNDAYIHSLGIPREKVINQSASVVYGLEFIDNYFKLVQKIPEIGKGKPFETYFPPLDKYYLTTLFKIGTDLYVTLGVDITEHKNLEIELEIERNNLELKVQERTEELVESERKLTEAQKIVHIGNWELDLETNKLWISDEVYHIFGYDSKFINAPDLQKLEITYDVLLNSIVHPDDRKLLDKSFKEALKGEKHYNIDHRIILPSGEERIIHERAELVYDENKTPVKMTGTIQDVTELKKIEESLRESEKKFREIFNKANDMISLNEMANRMPGKFIEVNEVGLKRLGYTKEEILNMGPVDIVAPEKRKEMPENAAVLIKNGSNTFEIVHITKDGRKIPVEINNHLINYRGREVCLAISRDITERKKMENELRESEKKFKEIFNKSQDMISLANLREDGLPGKFIEVNEVGLKRLGYSREEILNMDIMDIISKEKKKDVAKYAVEIWTKGHATFEIVHKTKEGKKIPAEVNAHLFKMNDRNVVLATSRDISERKKSEENLKELLQKLSTSNEELEQFAYIISHDLQEPLRTIANFTGLLKRRYEGQFDSDADEFMDYIVDASVRMKQMIQDLLEYSRVSSSKGDFELLDLNKLLGAVLSDLKLIINENKADITYEKLPVVLGDYDQISRVFSNFISNAIKFKKENEPPKIHIWSKENERNHEYIFKIQDNGIGIEKEYLDRIFVIFQRLHTREKYKGSGLGLSISKKIIEIHGGRIWVESEPGVGSTFIFTLKKP